MVRGTHHLLPVTLMLVCGSCHVRVCHRLVDDYNGAHVLVLAHCEITTRRRIQLLLILI